MNQDTLHCVQGETYSCVLSKEKKIAVKSCKRVGGMWYEGECMLRDNQSGGMSVCFWDSY